MADQLKETATESRDDLLPVQREVLDVLTKSTKRFADEIETTGPAWLGGFGAVIIVVALIGQINVPGDELLALEPEEFIALVLAGLLLLCLGSGVLGIQLRAKERVEVARTEVLKQFVPFLGPGRRDSASPQDDNGQPPLEP